MTRNRSNQANRFGTAAEKWLADRRGLDRVGQHTSWCDARFQNGVPVEIKSGMVSTGYFQIYRKYHDTLRRQGGYYGFVVYKPHGGGIRVIKSKLIPADRLPLRSMWSPTGGHRDSKKAKVDFDQIFR